jgi:hypothetical protein
MQGTRFSEEQRARITVKAVLGGTVLGNMPIQLCTNIVEKCTYMSAGSSPCRNAKEASFFSDMSITASSFRMTVNALHKG